ncbi:MAG: SRPBCC family protein, partial [Hyphomonadaceae bacterium]|nr:SRPBCC family protein [Hyphomonadaceae bacterium]
AIPRTTSATLEIAFDADIREVWEVYTQPDRQTEWRSGVAAVSMGADGRSWSETLERGGLVIHFKIIEREAPYRLVLETGADNTFTGRYVAEFREADGRTIGVFTEEATSLTLFAKVFRFLFVNQSRFIRQYADEAKAEISRRRTAG